MAEEESIQTNLSNTLTQTEPEPAVVMGTQVQAETNTIDVQTT